MIENSFSFYADYYAYIAESGLNCAQSLFKAIDPIQRIDLLTFDLFEDAQSARDDFNFAIQTSYETVFSNVHQTASMETAFNALANYVKRNHASVDDFLSSFGIQVLPVYASISNVLGESISSNNIKES